MPISIRYGKHVKITKCLSQLGMEKCKNRKMPISISYGKISKCLSQLGMENVKIAKCLSQIGMEKMQKMQKVYLN